MADRATGHWGVVVPPELNFAALKLHRRPGNILAFDYQVLMKVWRASGMQSDDLYRSSSSDISHFIAKWYLQHVKSGGPTHPEEDAAIHAALNLRPQVWVMPV